MDDKLLSLYAVCPPGLESTLADELSKLGIGQIPAGSAQKSPHTIEPGAGGVEFAGALLDVYRANLHLRCASRILLRLGSFHASKFVELARKSGNLAWDKFIVKDRPIALRVTSHRSRLYHTGAVAERVASGLSERLGAAVKVEKYSADSQNAQLIIVRLVNDECSISLDTSGAPLHQRGYRQALAKAPLRETLAAGILFASGWEQHSPLVDPFCGSGAIPIEATLMAMRIPPGLNRRFAFMEWPGFDLAVWEALRTDAERRVQPPAAPILASDRDAGAVNMALENAARAGVADWVEITQRAVSAVEPPAQPGWVATNPPYGLRVSPSQDLRNLYAQFGNVLRARFPGWQVAFLCNDDLLATQTRLIFQEGLSLVNGGVPVKLNRAVVPAQTLR